MSEIQRKNMTQIQSKNPKYCNYIHVQIGQLCIKNKFDIF